MGEKTEVAAERGDHFPKVTHFASARVGTSAQPGF